MIIMAKCLRGTDSRYTNGKTYEVYEPGPYFVGEDGVFSAPDGWGSDNDWEIQSVTMCGITIYEKP